MSKKAREVKKLHRRMKAVWKKLEERQVIDRSFENFLLGGPSIIAIEPCGKMREATPNEVSDLLVRKDVKKRELHYDILTKRFNNFKPNNYEK
jgi:uncharacterized coiled-coil protein SlyX